MSLRKKIILGFVVGAFVIAVLVVFEYINFIEIRKEIRFLELADTIRSKSLQIRRHEKNFFLYPAQAGAESRSVRAYLNDLKDVLADRALTDRAGTAAAFREIVNEYGWRFEKVELLLNEVQKEFNRQRQTLRGDPSFFPLIELTFFERPLEGAQFLEKVFHVPPDRRITTALRELDTEVQALRKSGEDLLIASKELDRRAREKAESVIRVSQQAVFLIFPLFVIVGVGTLFLITNGVVNRLRLLTGMVEKTGAGQFSHLSLPRRKWQDADEVSVLINKFNEMEDQLDQRERELVESKKLAAIGALASGVAHELNNPLNNIHISSQVLAREVGEDCPPKVRETVGEILSQTRRVKKIVGDLLEFARGREPRLQPVDMTEIMRDAYRLVSATIDTGQIRFSVENGRDAVVDADPEQMERVFINLFANAVEAMGGAGDLRVSVERKKGDVRISVADTGKGISAEDLEKVFEPFFSTKERGTGLGLAIVFNIVRRHGGEIKVESMEGRGTTFTIKLPAGGGNAV